jgi:hypothetical protein
MRLAAALIRALGWHHPIDASWWRRHDEHLAYLEAQARALREWARVVARRRRDADRDG